MNFLLILKLLLPEVADIKWKRKSDPMIYDLNQLTQLYPNATYELVTTTSISTKNSITISLPTSLKYMVLCVLGNLKYVSDYYRFKISNLNTNDEGSFLLYSKDGGVLLEWEVTFETMLSTKSTDYFALQMSNKNNTFRLLYEKLISIFPQ